MTEPTAAVPTTGETTLPDPPTTVPISDANLFTLNGDGLNVRLALSGIDGRPQLNYQDSNNSKSFTGDEITIEQGVMGRLASVTTLTTADGGHSTFTLILPVVAQTSGPHTVSTIGVTTLHRTTLGAYGHGQLTSYHVTELRGSARHVES